MGSAPQGENTSYQKLLEKNGPIIKDAGLEISKFAPKVSIIYTKFRNKYSINVCKFLQALIAIGTEPVNSIVPMFSEVMKKRGHYNPAAIFGITTIDVVRANKFVAEVLGLEPECVVVPIVGGHTDKTIVPILTKATPCAEFTNVIR